jgi:hypothetical protein
MFVLVILHTQILATVPMLLLHAWHILSKHVIANMMFDHFSQLKKISYKTAAAVCINMHLHVETHAAGKVK